MKLFKDKELTEEIDISPNQPIPLGIVDSGEVEQFEFYVLNDSPHELIKLKYYLKKIDRKTGLVTEIVSEESTVIEAPETILPYASDIIIIEYAPLVTIELGLKVQLQIRAKEIRD